MQYYCIHHSKLNQVFQKDCANRNSSNTLSYCFLSGILFSQWDNKVNVFSEKTFYYFEPLTGKSEIISALIGKLLIILIM